MAGEIRSFYLEGPAGRLEALLNQGEPQARYAALVCHPHPLYGGTMHNKVVYRAMKALNGFGFPVLRFNFRGAGLSQGEHDEGRGEQQDVAAALGWLNSEFHLPVVFAGFSFGAATGMRVACAEEVAAIISIGTPVEAEGRSYGYEFLARCTKPKLFVSGGRDPFGPREELEKLVEHASPPRELVMVEGADHFFAGKLPELQAAMERWAAATLHL
jgi:alpha/beta superfamily hydrolase